MQLKKHIIWTRARPMDIPEFEKSERRTRDYAKCNALDYAGGNQYLCLELHLLIGLNLERTGCFHELLQDLRGLLILSSNDLR